MFELETPIQTMIDATNRGDNEAFLSVFSEDAVLTDWGRTFTGKTEIARWNSNENIGTQNQIRVTGVERSRSSVSVSVEVTGNGYNGSGKFIFEMEAQVDQAAAHHRVATSSIRRGPRAISPAAV
jgi:ketosteroid isomerase-like protein